MTVKFSEANGALVFAVTVVARASRSEIADEHDGTLRVRVAAPPVEGAANEELTRTLARAFDVAAGAVEITSGHASKRKRVRVRGADASRLEAVAK